MLLQSGKHIVPNLLGLLITSAFMYARLKLSVISKCYLHVSPCLACHLSLCFTAHYGVTELASLPSSYPSAWRWSHGKFSADDRQLPRLLSINSAYFSSTFLGSQFFSSSHLYLDLTDLPSPSHILSHLPSVYPFLPNTCMDRFLAASANPSQTPPYLPHHKFQNPPKGPQPNHRMCNSEPGKSTLFSNYI